jgi:hypothetical protein
MNDWQRGKAWARVTNRASGHLDDKSVTQTHQSATEFYLKRTHAKKAASEEAALYEH